MKQEIKESSQNQAATAGQNDPTETHATKTEKPADAEAQTGGVSSPVLCSGLSEAFVAVFNDPTIGTEHVSKYITTTDFVVVSEECQQWSRQGLSLESLLKAESAPQSENKQIGTLPTPSPDSVQAQAEQFSRMGIVVGKTHS